MKRICTIFLVILFTSFRSSAQSLAFGPELGVNYIKLDNSYAGNNYTAGWHAGSFLEYAFSENFSIRSGVYFTQKKQNYAVADTSILPILSAIGIEDIDQFDLNTYSETNGRVTQNYFELPLQAKASYNGFSLLAGVYGALMFKSIGKETIVKNTPILSVINADEFGFLGSFIPPASSTTNQTVENSNLLRTFDFGARFGASYRLDKLELNLAYSLGLLDYRKNAMGLEARKHQYFQLSLAYNFGSDPGNSNFWQSKKMQ